MEKEKSSLYIRLFFAQHKKGLTSDFKSESVWCSVRLSGGAGSAGAKSRHQCLSNGRPGRILSLREASQSDLVLYTSD